jgi:hypothetical protein
MPDNKENQATQPVISKKHYEVTSEGSLGLLALGAAGIRAWKKKIAEDKQSQRSLKGNE